MVKKSRKSRVDSLPGIKIYCRTLVKNPVKFWCRDLCINGTNREKAQKQIYVYVTTFNTIKSERSIY